MPKLSQKQLQSSLDLQATLKQRIVSKCPYDIQSRLEESGEPINHITIVEEAEYVLQMIIDGGSDYDYEDTKEYVKELKQLIKWGKQIK